MLYRDAGVNINAMDSVKRSIGRLARSTYSPFVLSEPGLFGSLVRVPRMRDPVLVASCDGVGTKLLVARAAGRYDAVGHDIVNHSVNDILTLGARPLFFLDYIAHSSLAPEALVEVARGLAQACRLNHCALVGGETAMMPDIYRPGDLDLVGFIVGVVERRRIVDPCRLRPGDVAIGLPSSGLHTNGYSLARKALFQKARLRVTSRVAGLRGTLGQVLLAPHRSYCALVHPLLRDIVALAHITGGGFESNIGRLLPVETSCVIRKAAWQPSRLFRLIQEAAEAPDDEMYRTFNMGIGMVLFVRPAVAHRVAGRLRGARIIGQLVRGTFGVAVV